MNLWLFGVSPPPNWWWHWRKDVREIWCPEFVLHLCWLPDPFNFKVSEWLGTVWRLVLSKLFNIIFRKCFNSVSFVHGSAVYIESLCTCVYILNLCPVGVDWMLYGGSGLYWAEWFAHSFWAMWAPMHLKLISPVTCFFFYLVVTKVSRSSVAPDN